MALTELPYKTEEEWVNAYTSGAISAEDYVRGLNQMVWEQSGFTNIRPADNSQGYQGTAEPTMVADTPYGPRVIASYQHGDPRFGEKFLTTAALTLGGAALGGALGGAAAEGGAAAGAGEGAAAGGAAGAEGGAAAGSGAAAGGAAPYFGAAPVTGLTSGGTALGGAGAVGAGAYGGMDSGAVAGADYSGAASEPYGGFDSGAVAGADYSGLEGGALGGGTLGTLATGSQALSAGGGASGGEGGGSSGGSASGGSLMDSWLVDDRDWLSMLMRGAPGILGALGSASQASSQRDLAKQYMSMGAPYRSRLEQLYGNPQAFLESPEVRQPIQQGTDVLARSLSTKGNPIGSGNALQELQNYASTQLFNRLGQEKDRLAGFGGLTQYNQAAPQAASNAIAAKGDVYGNLGGAAADIFNPPRRYRLEDLLRAY